jgi:hypothetical protein
VQPANAMIVSVAREPKDLNLGMAASFSAQGELQTTRSRRPCRFLADRGTSSLRNVFD